MRWTMISVSILDWKMDPCDSNSPRMRKGIGQVAVVGDRDAPLGIIDQKGLGVFKFTRSRRGIPDMADGILSRKFFQIVPVEDFGDEPHLPIVIEPGSIRGDDPALSWPRC